MRFFNIAVAALFATTQAVNINQVPEEANLVATMVEAEGPMKLDEMFAAVDTNNDGALTMKEIRKAIRAYAKEHGIKLPKGWRKEVHQIFKHVDANKDGKITMKEIRSAIWDAVDGNNDGFWSLKEVFDALKATADYMDVKLKKGWRREVKTAF